MSNTTTTVSTVRKASVNKVSANLATLDLVAARANRPTEGATPEQGAAYAAAVATFRPIADKRLGSVATNLLIDAVNNLTDAEVASILKFASR